MAGPLLDADPGLVEDLVAADRILYDQKVVDGFGHVSVRRDQRADCFLLARNMAPGLVTGADIMAFDLDGAALGDDPRAVDLERFIHAEIYRARPEVGNVDPAAGSSATPAGAMVPIGDRRYSPAPLEAAPGNEERWH
jgi:hypothetical protein